ncbi:MAG: hypothetical protein R3296_00965 [Oleiphilaceae bacterium]|nr:hypothetical protein [Oleiphilaceae bacterium]
MSIEKALLDPADVYDSPASVCDDTRLSQSQKVEVLRRWEYDARSQIVAEEENMPDQEGDAGDTLDQVLEALKKLGENPDGDHPAPTKQGGV